MTVSIRRACTRSLFWRFAEDSKCHAVVDFLEANAPDLFCDVGTGRGSVGRGIQLPAFIGFSDRAVNRRAVGKFDRANGARSQVGKVVETRNYPPVTRKQMGVGGSQNHLSGDYTLTACRPKIPDLRVLSIGFRRAIFTFREVFLLDGKWPGSTEVRAWRSRIDTNGKHQPILV